MPQIQAEKPGGGRRLKTICLHRRSCSLRSDAGSLRFVSSGLKSDEQIENEFKLGMPLAQYHLSMLVKALVIERSVGGYRA
ncbi:MAG: hypothetical protein GYA39_01445 [Methanothrix sp.]|nr:hypothetical protein [Methanothrix sp.]